MVREFNFSNEAANRAAGTISAGLYERKALDCTVPLPLIVTLNNLAYLVANNRKIRELLCEDGGLERLIRILREVPKNNGSFTRPLHNKDLQPMWKWTTAFQCIVHLCIRGGVTVRERAVEAGIVPILVKVLESYLCFSDAMRAERKRVAEEKRQQRQGIETEDQRAERQQRARERERDRREWERQASLIAAATANLGRRDTTDVTRRAPTRTINPGPAGEQPDTPALTARPTLPEAVPTTPQPTALSLPSPPSAPRPPHRSTSPLRSRTALSPTSLTQSVNTHTNQPSSASSSTRVEQPTGISSSSSSSSSASAHHSRPTSSVDRMDTDVTSIPGSHSGIAIDSPSVRTSDLRPRGAEFNVLSDAADTTLGGPLAPEGLAGPSNTSLRSVHSRASHEGELSSNASNEDLQTGGGWSGSEAAEEAELSGEGDELEESEAERRHHRHGSESTRGSRREDAEERRTPRASRRALAPLQVTMESTADQYQQADRPATEPMTAIDITTPRAAETVYPPAEVNDEGHRHHQHHHHGRDRHATVTSRTRPVLPTTYIAETFDPTDMAFREEEVLLSLQILAYLTKYSHIRALLRFPEMTRATNLHDLDVLWAEAATSPGTPLWQPGSPFHRSIYTIAERYTCRATRRDPSAEFIAGTTKLAPLIQYWAGVVMRNACRKDDRVNDPHSGLRQCGNMLCGKWETQPREFAKCRRCKKAKFCSKICQSTSWQIGHKYWCSSIADDSESSRARSHRTQETQPMAETNTGLGEPFQSLQDRGGPADTNQDSDIFPPEDRRHQRPDQNEPHIEGDEAAEADEAMTAPTPRQRNRGSSFARVPTNRRPSVLNGSQANGVPSRITSEAVSVNASDVSEDDEAEASNTRPTQTSENDLSEHEQGSHPTTLVGGFRFNAPPAPRRTDIAGRPLPPPVIAGTGMELAGRQGLAEDGIGMADSDDHFGTHFNAAVVEDQFGRGDIDQITWRGQTPTPDLQEAHGHHRPLPQQHQLFEPGNGDRVPFPIAGDLGNRHGEPRQFRAPEIATRPLTASMSQQAALHAPVPHSSRRFPSMVIESSTSAEASRPVHLSTTDVDGTSTGIDVDSSRATTARRAVSGVVASPSSDLGSDPLGADETNAVFRHLRGQNYGLHHHHSQGQHLNHLLIRGGIAAGLMGRSVTPTAYDLDSHATRGGSGGGGSSHSHPTRPSSSDLPLRSMMGSASALSSPLSSRTEMVTGDERTSMDDQMTPSLERRNPFESSTRGAGAGSSNSSSRVTEHPAHGYPTTTLDKRREDLSTNTPSTTTSHPIMEFQTSLLGNATPSGSRFNSTGGSTGRLAQDIPSSSSASGRSSPDQMMEMSPNHTATQIGRGVMDEDPSDQMNLD